MQCITVAREDGLFLVGRGHVVTYNSEQDIKTGTRCRSTRRGIGIRQARDSAHVGRRRTCGHDSMEHFRFNSEGCSTMLQKEPGCGPVGGGGVSAILPSGKSLWPEKWSIDSLLRTKASLDPKYWTAQYMQEPSSDEAAIVARTDWRVWEKAAAVVQLHHPVPGHRGGTTNRADFVHHHLGVFVNEVERDEHQIILLDRVNQRMQFPDSRPRRSSSSRPGNLTRSSSKKNSGVALYQELRFAGPAGAGYSPPQLGRQTRWPTSSKGQVWIPDTWWARELIDQIAQFPNGEHDDDVDTTSMALRAFGRAAT